MIIPLEIKKRLDYIEEQIKKEKVSYGELAELYSLKEYIPKDNVNLREWAGVDESEE